MQAVQFHTTANITDSIIIIISAIMCTCVRGARSACHRPQRYDVELASLSGGEGATLILLNSLN